MAKKQTTRAPGKTQISISLSLDLVKKIDALATADHRNRSNFIANQLQQLVDDAEPATPARRR